MRGRFITMEGGEGAGKSTMMERVAGWLEHSGYRVICTREAWARIARNSGRERPAWRMNQTGVVSTGSRAAARR